MLTYLYIYSDVSYMYIQRRFEWCRDGDGDGDTSTETIFQAGGTRNAMFIFMDSDSLLVVCSKDHES